MLENKSYLFLETFNNQIFHAVFDIKLSVWQEIVFDRIANNFEALLEFVKVGLIGWDFFAKYVAFMLAKESTVRTYFLKITSLAHQLLSLPMLRAIPRHQ